MPIRAAGYQAISGFSGSDATLYDGNTATGYERGPGASGGTLAITGKLDLGPSPSACATMRVYLKYGDALGYDIDYSADDMAYTNTVHVAVGTPFHAGVYSGVSTSVAISSISSRYWRVSIQDTGRLGRTPQIGLMELEALDGSGTHINEGGVSVSLSPTSTVVANGAVAIGNLVQVTSCTSAISLVSTSTVYTPGIIPISAIVVSSTVAGLNSKYASVKRAVSTVNVNSSLLYLSALYPIATVSSITVVSNCAPITDAAQPGLITSAPSVILINSTMVGGGVGGISPLTPLSTVGMKSVALIGGDITVWAQGLFDYISWYPGIGDVFGHVGGKPYPAYDATKPDIELRTGKVLRGTSDGLILAQSPRAPYSGAIVSVQESLAPNTPSGSDTSKSDGQYQTGSPGGRGDLGMTITCQVGDTPYPAASDTFRARKRHRHSFLIQQPSRYASIENDGQHGVLFVSVDKKIKAYQASTAAKIYQSSDLAPDGFVKMRWERRTGTIYAIGLIGSTTYKVYASPGGGLSVTELLSMTGKSALIETVGESGTLVLIYTDNSDVVYQRKSVDRGLTWSSPTSATLDTGAFSGKLIDSCYERRLSTIFMTVQEVTGANALKVVASTNLGVNWKTSIR